MTVTQRGLRCKTRGDRHETQETLSILCPKLHSRQDVALAALLSQMRSGSLHQSRYGKDIVAHWSVQSAAHRTYVRSWRLGSGAPLRMPAKALFATCPVSLCPTTELFYSSIEQGSDDLNYRRNTLNTLFRPRITSLCHDVCDTLMSRFSALAMPALSKRTIRYTLEREREREREGSFITTIKKSLKDRQRSCQFTIKR